MSEVATMLAYGHAPMEMVLKQRRGPGEADGRYRSQYSDNRYGIRKIALRAQHTIESWDWDEYGDLRGFWQYRWSEALPPVYVPIERILMFRTKAVSGNPEGHSILRACYAPWWRKNRTEEIEAIGIERDLAGLPIYMAPADQLDPSTPDGARRHQDALRLVSSVKRNAQEGLVIPSNRDEKGNLFYDFKLLSSGGTRAINIDATIQRYDAAILGSTLSDFMKLGQGSSGSWALSKDKTEMFSIALNVFLGSIADTLNRGLLPKLWAINGFDVEVMPKWVPGSIEPPDLGAIGSILTAMTTAGATLFPDDRLEDHIRSQSGFPPIPEDRDLQQQEAAQAAMDHQIALVTATAEATAPADNADDADNAPEEKPRPGKPKLVAKMAPEPDGNAPGPLDMDKIMRGLADRLAARG
jgi:hypothetical protein